MKSVLAMSPIGKTLQMSDAILMVGTVAYWIYKHFKKVEKGKRFLVLKEGVVKALQKGMQLYATSIKRGLGVKGVA